MKLERKLEFMQIVSCKRKASFRLLLKWTSFLNKEVVIIYGRGGGGGGAKRKELGKQNFGCVRSWVNGKQNHLESCLFSFQSMTCSIIELRPKSIVNCHHTTGSKWCGPFSIYEQPKQVRVRVGGGGVGLLTIFIFRIDMVYVQTT